MKKLSIVIPVYFNEPNLEDLYEKLSANVLQKLEDMSYEIVMVDDGSLDNSYKLMQELRKKDKNVKLVKLSRNFGSHSAILAGLTHAKGDCATVISADLQDPPEIILKMLKKWQDGSKVVLAVREDREEPAMQKAFSNTYYKLMKKFALSDMPEGGFDCFLVDRQVLDVLTKMEEKNTTLMGQVIWCGFKHEMIYYTRKNREKGESRWTLGKKIKLFVDSFVSFSYFPIRLVEVIGILFSAFSLLWLIYILLAKLLGGIDAAGWTTLMAVVLLSSGLILLTLGVIGEYLWRIFDAVRKRPVFIVEETKGIEEEK